MTMVQSKKRALGGDVKITTLSEIIQRWKKRKTEIEETKVVPVVDKPESMKKKTTKKVSVVATKLKKKKINDKAVSVVAKPPKKMMVNGEAGSGVSKPRILKKNLKTEAVLGIAKRKLKKIKTESVSVVAEPKLEKIETEAVLVVAKPKKKKMVNGEAVLVVAKPKKKKKMVNGEAVLVAGKSPPKMIVNDEAISVVAVNDEAVSVVAVNDEAISVAVNDEAVSVVAVNDESISVVAKPENLSKKEIAKLVKDEDAHIDITFEENDRMTCYDGVWISHEKVEKLNNLKMKFARELMAFKFKCQRDLRSQIICDMKQSGTARTHYGGVEQEAKRYGIWLSKDSVVRLKQYRDKLLVEGTPIKDLINKLRRRRRLESTSFYNSSHSHCINCNEKDHLVYTCPKIGKLLSCYTCGSTTHVRKDCPSGMAAYNHAVCKACDQVGHLSRDCPTTLTNSVYPKGGACGLCGCPFHFPENCTLLMMNSY